MNEKICPLMSIISKDNYCVCAGERCAWWRNGECAVLCMADCVVDTFLTLDDLAKGKEAQHE